MDYKEKYKEALERARKEWVENLDNCYTNYRERLEIIFPELKESEEERIRKAIHIYLDWLDGRKDYAPKGIYSIKDMIAWLKKQGEQTQLDYEHVNIPQKDFTPIEHKTLNADKVIEWIHKYWPFSWGNFSFPVDEAIELFKKDFGL